MNSADYIYIYVSIYICSGDNQRKLGHQFKRKTVSVQEWLVGGKERQERRQLYFN